MAKFDMVLKLKTININCSTCDNKIIAAFNGGQRISYFDLAEEEGWKYNKNTKSYMCDSCIERGQMKNAFTTGQTVYDTLALDYCIFRGIENGFVKLSRVDKPESFYYNLVHLITVPQPEAVKR